MNNGLTFKQVCEKYKHDYVGIYPRTFRFVKGVKKLYWQIRWGHESTFEPRMPEPRS